MMRALRWPLLAAVALLGCESVTEEGEEPGEGRIRVNVATSGADPQSDHFLLSLDGTRALTVGPNGSAIYDNVAEGTHVVHLFSLADNCAVSNGASPQSVVVRNGDFSQVSFSVVCSEPVSGGFRVIVTTAGPLVDEDGYQLSVASTPLRNIGVNAEEVYQGLEEGTYLITLKDVADFCDVRGANPSLYTLVPGKQVAVAIRVDCGIEPGPL
jgi:hypothetical protein